ncbi:hypothetical protein DRV85_17205 [Rhodosalinus halophilus]|uniref:Restriction system protein Mrr-like N-terminal domain-containing protein n=1 Tax=Rhodosalinus halophilus TaxID=2259333 RepID=A0A365U5W8_9RHOB|nr:hypothetical protein DRV85_17205 [Rhodosalinus halophilus]
MANRADLVAWVENALHALGGEATIVDVAKHLWSEHEDELRRSGDLFYTWQYDMRWAALKLRKDGKLADANRSKRGTWALR